jgi:hypothetical protein
MLASAPPRQVRARGRQLRVPNPDHEIDKQIAAIALVKDLTVVTRNTADFEGTGVRLKNHACLVTHIQAVGPEAERKRERRALS